MDLRIRGVTRDYQSDGKRIRALDHVDLSIASNEIFTLLGPSGCGKTTLLRCIVGLETPDSGEIAIGDEIVFSSEKGISLSPEKRGLGMVFQTYAIWPHMNVFENVAYPLKARKIPRNEILDRVENALRFVQLAGFGNRPATKLSGGQQQRVALARALVAEPKVILFDEPLSNLDAKLREETRKELHRFLTELKITAVYVTHDRIEALALSDRIAVMKEGRIVEIGDPKKIYFNADHPFVADFIGRANLIPATVSRFTETQAAVDTAIGPMLVRTARNVAIGQQATVCARPEFIRIGAAIAGNSPNVFQGKVVHLIFVGEAYEAEIRIGDTLLTTTIEPTVPIEAGGEITIAFDPDHCFLMPS
jgi:iron(III) transport system ATP-binding protein